MARTDDAEYLDEVVARVHRDKERVQSWWQGAVGRGIQRMPWFVQSLVKRVERESGETFDVRQGRWIPKG